MDNRHSQWYGSDHAIVGETNGNNDLYLGSAKCGRLQRHGASSSDSQSKTKRRSRPDVGLCEPIDEYVDNEHDLVAKSSGRNVGTVGNYSSSSDDFG